MARKKVLKNFLKFQNLPQTLLIVAIAGVVIGLIIFNIFSGKQPTPKLSPDQTAKQVQGESKFPPVQLPTTHKVTFGDSLTKLSNKYYGEAGLWPGIAKANDLKKPSSIEPNIELKVPTKEEVQKVQISELRTAGRENITGNTYSVDYGDTLFEIAQRAYGDGSKWTLIDQANHLGRLANDNPLIHAGNVLVIPR